MFLDREAALSRFRSSLNLPIGKLARPSLRSPFDGKEPLKNKKKAAGGFNKKFQKIGFVNVKSFLAKERKPFLASSVQTIDREFVAFSFKDKSVCFEAGYEYYIVNVTKKGAKAQSSTIRVFVTDQVPVRPPGS